MRVPATARWIGLALLGILIAAGISVAASRLASQQIGLASEPLTAGDALAPHTRGEKPHAHREKPSRPPAPSHRGHRRESTTPSAPAPPPTTTPAAPPTTTPAAPPTTTPAPAHGDETGQAGEGGDGGGGGDD